MMEKRVLSEGAKRKRVQLGEEIDLKSRTMAEGSVYLIHDRSLVLI